MIVSGLRPKKIKMIARYVYMYKHTHIYIVIFNLLNNHKKKIKQILNDKGIYLHAKGQAKTKF